MTHALEFDMKQIQFTCDGCDLVEHVVLLTQDAANLSVDGWVAYRGGRARERCRALPDFGGPVS